MPEVTVVSSGWEEVLRIIDRMPVIARLALRDAAVTLRGQVAGTTPVDTGMLQLGWSQVQYTMSAMSFSFNNAVPYAHILEEGLYPNAVPGPRTTGVAGAMFSRQAPSGMLAPWIDDQAKVAQLVDWVISALDTYVGELRA